MADRGDINFSQYSFDDLCFEVKRLRQKCEVLERDKAILEDELKIGNDSKAPNSSSVSMMEDELRKQTEFLRSYREKFYILANKYYVVRRHLDLEKKTLREVRDELNAGTQDIMNISKNALHKTVIYYEERENKSQKSYKLLKTQYDALNNENNNLKKSLEDNLVTTKTLESIISTLESSQLSEKNQLLNQINELRQNQNNLITSHTEILIQKDQQIQEYDKMNKIMKLQLESLIKNNNIIEIRNNELLQTIQQSDYKTKDLLEQNSLLNNQINTQYQKELSDLNNKLILLTNQIQCLNQTMNDLENSKMKLQNDYEKLLQNYENLQIEIKEKNTLTENEMQKKFINIKEKMKILENDTSNEIQRLKDLLAEESNRLWETTRDRDAKINIILLSESKCRELQSLNSSLQQQISELNVSIGLLERNIESIQFKLEKKEVQLTELQLEKENQMNEFNQLKKVMGDKERTYNSMAEEVSILTFQSKTKEKKYLDHINEFELKITSYENEIRALKQTIHRECEERTELMIELSTLKDFIHHNGLTTTNGDVTVRDSTLLSTPRNLQIYNNATNTQNLNTLNSTILSTKSDRIAPLPNATDDVEWIQRNKNRSKGSNTNINRRSHGSIFK